MVKTTKRKLSLENERKYRNICYTKHYRYNFISEIYILTMENMNDKLKKQFIGLRGLIYSHIESIRALLQQAKQLEDLTSTFSTTGNDKVQKQQLEKIVQSIYGTISTLVDKTNDLFDEYMKILRSSLDN